MALCGNLESKCQVSREVLRVWSYFKSWEWYGKDRSNRANLYEKIREINCKESASPLEQKSAIFILADLTLLSWSWSSESIKIKTHPIPTSLIFILGNTLFHSVFVQRLILKWEYPL
jgi:hypothetical protein